MSENIEPLHEDNKLGDLLSILVDTDSTKEVKRVQGWHPGTWVKVSPLTWTQMRRRITSFVSAVTYSRDTATSFMAKFHLISVLGPNLHVSRKGK